VKQRWFATEPVRKSGVTYYEIYNKLNKTRVFCQTKEKRSVARIAIKATLERMNRSR